MKTVLYVGNFSLPESSASGKRVLGVSLLLLQCGYSVQMLGTDKNCINSEHKVSDGISFTSFPNFGKSNGLKYFTWLKRYIKEHNISPCFIIRYGSPGLATFDFYLLHYCHANQIPVIADVVDWLYAGSTSLLFNIFKSVDTFLEKAIFNSWSDGLIVISNYLFSYYNQKKKKIILIPPLANNLDLSSSNTSVPHIIYAGIPFRKNVRIRDSKQMKDRLDSIVTAFGLLEQKGFKFCLHIIGLTKSEFLIAFPDLEKYVDQSKQIIFHGAMPMEQIKDFYGKSDFSVLLRDKSRATDAGFPTKVVESMSYNVPVITNRTSDLSSYIKNDHNGFLVAFDSMNNLVSQLESILKKDKDHIKEIKETIYREKIFSSDAFFPSFRTYLQSMNLPL